MEMTLAIDFLCFLSDDEFETKLQYERIDISEILVGMRLLIGSIILC